MSQVPYTHTEDAGESWLRGSQPRSDLIKVSLVELSLYSRVLPFATETLRVAELVRAALMKKAGEKSRLLSGKNGDGVPLKGHRHTFFLPQFDDLDRINRVMLILNHEAFDPREVEAILGLEFLARFDEEPIRVAVTRAGLENERDSATTVVTSTPFIPVRHWREGRGEWRDFVVSEVRLECEHHGLPEPLRIEPSKLRSPRFEPVHFRRSRKNDPPRRGMGIAIEFAKAVRIPFSLGYGCHFGLGQFVLRPLPPGGRN
jgi:CRISPR-associated protein Csb2